MVLGATWRLCLVSLKITRLYLIGYCLFGIISYSKSLLWVRTRFLQILNIIRHNETWSGGESVKRSQPVPESEYYSLWWYASCWARGISKSQFTETDPERKKERETGVSHGSQWNASGGNLKKHTTCWRTRTFLPTAVRNCDPCKGPLQRPKLAEELRKLHHSECNSWRST